MIMRNDYEADRPLQERSRLATPTQDVMSTLLLTIA